MIRAFKEQDIDQLMQLWLATNVSAHSFISPEYWQSNYEAVKAMLPSATLCVYEENNAVQGFVGLTGSYIAGIFVAQNVQSKGIGKKLLEHVKATQNTLLLNVYKANARAVDFYLREGFVFMSEAVDESTGQVEYSMKWVNSNDG